MTNNSTGTDTPAAQGPTTALDAVAAFESLMALDEQENQTEGEANPGPDEESVEAKGADEDHAVPELDPEQPEEVEETDQPEPAADVFTVKVDGKDVEVTREELLQGYSRTADYTRKTQQLAEHRKSMEAELEQARAERKEYAELLPRLRQALEAGLGPEPDWNALRQEDPQRAVLLWQQREDARRKLELARQEESRVVSQVEAEQIAANEARMAEERNALLEKIPQWRDETTRTRDIDAIKAAMAGVGFAEGEAVISDHRMMVLALKAARYDQLLAKKPELEKKRVNAPVVKPGGGVPGRTSDKQKAIANLAKTGTRDAAAAAFAQFL